MPHQIKIDLWFWRLDDPADRVTRWRSYLDRTEHARMDRFMFAQDQIRFTICRSRLRRILGWYTRHQPRDIRFGTIGRNKPTLEMAAGDGVQFNLSHTTGLACLAVCRDHPVGVDVERIREIKDEFIVYALNPAEQALVLPMPPIDRQAAFFRIWTAKEAYLKAIGTGLWQSLKTFDVDVPLASDEGEFLAGTLPRVDDAEQHARGWRIYTFRTGGAHIGAVSIAAPGAAEVIIRRRWLGD